MMQDTAYEKIRQLKAKYFRYIDTRRWQDLRALLCDDFIGDYGPSDEEQFTSADTFIEGLQRNLKDATTIHYGHMPEITMQGANRASAIWAMEDQIYAPSYQLHGHGHYIDEYREEAGQWLISRTRLTRLKLDIQPL